MKRVAVMSAKCFSLLICLALASIVACVDVTDVTATYKSSMTLNCTIAPAETVKFYKNNNLISFDGTKFVESSSMVLKINSLLSDDIKASYYCNRTSSQVNYAIKAVPYLYKVDHYNLIAIEGGSLSTTCYLLVGTQSSETITWTWYKDGRQVSTTDDTRYSISSSSTTSTLSISNGYTTDTGTYKCKATNSVGSGDRSVDLIIKSRLLPLWPFLGVLGEIAIVAAVIYGFEVINKKSPPKASEEEDDEEEPKDK